MIYTCKYKSPIGNILLAADEIGLIGLWFEGQKHFANTLFHRKRRFLQRQKNGWISIFPGKNQNLHRLLIQKEQNSDIMYGRSYCRFHMDRQSHTEKLPVKWLR